MQLTSATDPRHREARTHFNVVGNQVHVQVPFSDGVVEAVVPRGDTMELLAAAASLESLGRRERNHQISRADAIRLAPGSIQEAIYRLRQKSAAASFQGGLI